MRTVPWLAGSLGLAVRSGATRRAVRTVAAAQRAGVFAATARRLPLASPPAWLACGQSFIHAPASHPATRTASQIARSSPAGHHDQRTAQLALPAAASDSQVPPLHARSLTMATALRSRLLLQRAALLLGQRAGAGLPGGADPPSRCPCDPPLTSCGRRAPQAQGAARSTTRRAPLAPALRPRRARCSSAGESASAAAAASTQTW